MPSYRVGVIGLNIGREHLRAYQACQDAALVAIADVDAQALATYGDEYGVPGRYADYVQMLEQESLDIVSVTTSQALHPEMVVKAAGYGPKAILCEKPMAGDLGGAQAMLAACDAAGVKLAIGHQRRQLPVFERARELVAAGAIGQPLVCSVGVGEGGLLNQGSHLVDLVRYVLGDPEPTWVIGQVQRETDRYERGVPVEDLCMGIACFEGGARLVFDSDIEEHPALGNWGFTFTGDRGTLRITRVRDTYGTTFRLRLISSTHQNLDLGPGDFSLVDPFIAEVDELVAWIEGRREHRANAHIILSSHMLMVGFCESARTHRLVPMPLRTKRSPLLQMIEDGQLPVRYPGRHDIRRLAYLPPRESL